MSWLDWVVVEGEAAFDKRFDTPDHAALADSALGASRSQSQRRQSNLTQPPPRKRAAPCSPHRLLRYEQGCRALPASPLSGAGARMCNFGFETLTVRSASSPDNASDLQRVLPNVSTDFLRISGMVRLEIERRLLYFGEFDQSQR